MFFKRNVVLLTFNLSSLALYTLAGTDGVFGAISRATDFLLVESTSLVLEMRELCSTTRRRYIWGNPCNTTALLEAVRKLSQQL